MFAEFLAAEVQLIITEANCGARVGGFAHEKKAESRIAEIARLYSTEAQNEKRNNARRFNGLMG